MLWSNGISGVFGWRGCISNGALPLTTAGQFTIHITYSFDYINKNINDDTDSNSYMFNHYLGFNQLSVDQLEMISSRQFC